MWNLQTKKLLALFWFRMKYLVALTEEILNSQDLLKKRRPADAHPKPQQGLDIRTLFQRAETRNRETEEQQNKDSSVVIID